MTDSISKADDDLALMLLCDEEDVCRRLLEEYGPKFEVMLCNRFPSLRREDAEDAVAEAVADLWLNRENFDPDKAKLTTYLFTMCANNAKDVVSGQKEQQSALGRQLRNGMAIVSEIFQKNSCEKGREPSPELAAEVRKQFRTLPDVDQRILTNFSDAGATGFNLTSVQLGDEVGLSKGNVRVRKSRAIDKLKSKLRSVLDLLKKEGWDVDE